MARLIGVRAAEGVQLFLVLGQAEDLFALLLRARGRAPVDVELVQSRLHHGHAARVLRDGEEVVGVHADRHYPVVLQRLQGTHPLRWVDGQQTADEILGELRDVRPVLVGEFVLARLDATIHLGVRLAVKRRRRREQDVHDHTDRPAVARGAVAAQLAARHLLRKHLGRDVPGCAAARRHQKVVRDRRDLREPKVCDLELGLWLGCGKEDILRLEVAVADIAVVQVEDGV